MDTLIAIVTGASSGIGHEAALALRARGVTVYAAARRPMQDLEERGIRTLTLDVTDEESMRACVAAVVQREGRIDILVNNAGYGSYGAIEEVPIAEARRQFEVNVFGAMRMTQLVIEHMTGPHRGRIVNVSSMGAHFAMALGGWYHATKYALTALSDALRQEVYPFGIDVVLVEPALIHTEWPKVAAEHLTRAAGLGKYAAISRSFAAGLEFVGQGFGADPAILGRVVALASTTPYPRTRYRKGMGAWSMPLLLSLTPDRVVDAGIRFFLAHLDTILNLVRTTTPTDD
ncbi:MAG: oxidoreductase [Propionibacteriaceae bacterium]|nr:oxidoreductase [Propionibacteriaceae bacterium]